MIRAEWSSIQQARRKWREFLGARHPVYREAPGVVFEGRSARSWGSGLDDRLEAAAALGPAEARASRRGLERSRRRRYGADPATTAPELAADLDA